MATISLEECLRNAVQEPYTKSLKVTVVAVDSVRRYGDDKQVLNASVADSTRATKVVIYDQTKFSRFRENNTVIIRNFIRKPDSIVVTRMTKVFPTAAVDVPDHIRQSAISLIRPPPAEIQPLREALKSPLKTKVSVQGRIVQEDAPYEVKVQNDKVKIKPIYLKDMSHPKCKVSLWREAAETEFRTGDYVKVTDVVVNIYKSETSLSTTSLSSVQKTEAPEEETSIHVVGACVEELTVTLLLQDDADTIDMPLDVIQAAIPDLDDQDLESYLTSLCTPSFSLNCIYQGSDLIRVTFS